MDTTVLQAMPVSASSPPGSARPSPWVWLHRVSGYTAQATVDPADRLDFERQLQWLRLTFLCAPWLILFAFGHQVVASALLISVVILASYGWVWALQHYDQPKLLRYQLGLRLVDCLLVFIVLTNYHAFLHDAYYDAVYILFVVAAAATHGRRGAIVLGAASGVASLLGRLLLIRAGTMPFAQRHITDALFYTVFFTITGLAVAYLMERSAQVVERRDHQWRAALAERNQELERTAVQLRAANQELEAFAYSVSHDLRAPLRSIDGFSQVVLAKYGPQLDAGGQHYLERIRAGSQRMAQLIDDLLRLSRLTRTPLARQAVDLSALASEVIEELRQGHPERIVQVEIAAGLPTEADPRLLRVVLENLLGNAWKFTTAQPAPRIELTRHWGDDGEAVYVVRDNGAGFDMAYADKLFGAFQRLHSASEFEGNGIGLATAQRIIHRHGGRIWAQGAVGQGATFFFTLGIHSPTAFGDRRNG